MFDKSPQVTRRGFLKVSALSAAGFAVAGSGLISACGVQADPKDGVKYSYGPPADGTPLRGGQLRVGIISGGNAETVDVRRTTQVADIARISALYDPLWFVGIDGGTRPGLVEHAESNSDATVWTLTMRDGVEWHNGKSLTADDVVYTIQQSWVSADNVFSVVLKELIDVANIKALDAKTVHVPLKRGLAQLPTIAAIQNCYVVQDGFQSWNKPIGTGPFIMGSFTPGSSSEFRSYRNYWQGTPHLDSLVIDSSYAEDSTRLNALLAGDIDIMPGIPPSLARANATGLIYLGNQPGPGWTGPVFRVNADPYKDLRVRKAMKLSIDREAIVNTVFSGYGVAGNDCCGYTDQYFASSLKSEYDPEQAKSLLKQAGYDGLNVTIISSAISAETNPLATLWAEQAAKAGINVQVKQIDPSIYFTPAGGYQTRPLSVELWTNGVNSLSLFYLLDLVQGAPFTASQWGDPKSDALAYDAMSEVDTGKAAEKWMAVQQLQHDQGGTLNAVNYNWVDAYGRSVRGAKTTNAGPCDNWDFSTTWLKR